MGVFRKKAFTLIELMVAITLFMVVMTVATSTLMNVIYVNKKSQAIQIVVNNLNSTIDSMIRNIRTGSVYHCGLQGHLNTPRDCQTAEHAIAIREFGAPKGSYTLYYLKKKQAADGGEYGTIWRRKVDKHGTITEDIQLTPDEVDIEKFNIYVRGSSFTDDVQAYALVIIKGSIGKKDTLSNVLFGNQRRLRTEFLIQSSASQRLLDI